jgi:hypothetical protein
MTQNARSFCEGRRFLTASSGGWYEASVAFGTGPTAARAAADRTAVFYTGIPLGQGADLDAALRGYSGFEGWLPGGGRAVFDGAVA